MAGTVRSQGMDNRGDARQRQNTNDGAKHGTRYRRLSREIDLIEFSGMG